MLDIFCLAIFTVTTLEPSKKPVDKYVFWGNLAKGQMVKTFTNYGLEYEVIASFKLKPIISLLGWLNMIHVSKGGNSAEIGDRLPCIFLDDEGWWFGTGINNDPNHNFRVLHEMTDYFINISQRKIDNDYVYKIVINGETKFELVNSNPQSIDKIYVYLSDEWYNTFTSDDVILHYIKIYQWA